ncbi:radical SAM-linked protein [Saccharopolyspora lacisalsi]|uniref:Radical SAM-linked protein n=1 Tax=Halosaccharopolyspora lacisalsi TaxID=1000566 RepID=A0A839E122_9PSEU|nr:TIGR03936 family radical SAM-associated protein [Halosaccharopolyspora lacisalsi]MBA8825385.1 radical SAM-linked protein [Halosaccharopolyspora lacisalsi]
MSRHQPTSPAASVQKLRLRYAKRGRLRFTSHRDLARAFERGLRRAGVPMAHSRGFTPHPKVSWAGAVPTGAASEAEYVEIHLAEQVDPLKLHEQLRWVLPTGMDLLDVVPAGSDSLADRLEAGLWRIELPGVRVAELRSAVARLMEAPTVEVERMTKNGRRSLDARAAVISAEVHEGTPSCEELIALRVRESESDADMDDRAKDSEPYGILVTVVRQATPVVRPDDVLSALRVVAGPVLPVVARATRLRQGRLDERGELTDPLAQDRVAAGARRGEFPVG